jgi:soluble lytic murein transglycosylase-like protein
MPLSRTLAALAAATALALPGAAAADVPHDVAPGETLSGIATAAGVPLSTLAAHNGLSPDAFVVAGSTLQIPPAGAAPTALASSAAPATTTAAATPAAAPSPLGAYRVRLGDSLSAIAAEHGIPLSTLAAANGLDPAGVLLAGAELRLDGAGAPAAPAAAAPVAPASTVAATPGRTTSARISQIAGEHGVPGDLAAAIAWQESGFNNAMRSVADARGVMQILPGTWSWIQGSLAGGRQLDPGSTDDNVRAGSLFLGQLLRETGGDPALAAAGYYQGLASVRRIGMLPETRRYVDNVLALRSRFGG